MEPETVSRIITGDLESGNQTLSGNDADTKPFSGLFENGPVPFRRRTTRLEPKIEKRDRTVAPYGQVAPVMASVSMCQPGAPVNRSVPIRQRSLIVCPFMFCPRFAAVVM
jgi:hypothetical protein